MNGTLHFQSSTDLLQSAPISGTGTIIQEGGNTISLTAAGGNPFSGLTIVKSGTLVLAAPAGGNAFGGIAGNLQIGGSGGSAVVRLGADHQTNPAATISFNNGVTLGGTLDLQGFVTNVGSITATGATSTINGTAADGLIFSPNATIVGGPLVIAARIAPGNITLSATVTLNGVNSSSLAVTSTDSNITLGTNSPFGSLTVTGQTTLKPGASSVVLGAPITVNSSVFQILGTAQQSVTLTAPLTFNSDATFTTNGASIGDIAIGSHNLDITAPAPPALTLTTVGGTISGTGKVTLGGFLLYANVSFTGANTYSGGTNISSGALVIGNTSGSATGSGPVTVGGALSGTGFISGDVSVSNSTEAGLFPGSASDPEGTLTLGGNLSIASAGTFGVATNGITSSEVDIAGSLTLGGALKVSRGAAQLTLGEMFTILTSASDLPLTGTFTDAPGGVYSDGNGDKFQVNYAANVDGGSVANDVTLKVIAVPEPGSLALLAPAGLALFSRSRRRHTKLARRA